MGSKQQNNITLNMLEIKQYSNITLKIVNNQPIR